MNLTADRGGVDWALWMLTVSLTLQTKKYQGFPSCLIHSGLLTPNANIGQGQYELS